MIRLKENKVRERRIEMEIVVDAYNAGERAMGWYYYLEETLQFPFKARCKSKREISPLCVGEEVEVLGMAPEAECGSEMFVRVRWRGRKLAVPLASSNRREQMRKRAKLLPTGTTGWRTVINSDRDAVC